MGLRMTTAPAVDAAEQRLAELRQQQAATGTALEAAERDLAPSERALAEAQLIYDEAANYFVTAQSTQGGPGHAANDTWQLRSGADEVRLARAAAEATATFEAARTELEGALVQRNARDRRRSELRMHGRWLEAQIVTAEGELEVARAHSARARGLLETIRARVLGESAADGRA